jgi:hypothetical protein
MMDEAFEGLRRAEACPGHVWTAPRREESVVGKRIDVRYATSCTLCGLRASRFTRDQLVAEVIDS